jgi:hypothetical protein
MKNNTLFPRHVLIHLSVTETGKTDRSTILANKYQPIH